MLGKEDVSQDQGNRPLLSTHWVLCPRLRGRCLLLPTSVGGREMTASDVQTGKQVCFVTWLDREDRLTGSHTCSIPGTRPGLSQEWGGEEPCCPQPSPGPYPV